MSSNPQKGIPNSVLLPSRDTAQYSSWSLSLLQLHHNTVGVQREHAWVKWVATRKGTQIGRRSLEAKPTVRVEDSEHHIQQCGGSGVGVPILEIKTVTGARTLVGAGAAMAC